MDNQPQIPSSHLVVVFEALNSVNIRHMESDGISPLQLLALASYLELLGKSQLAQQIAEQQELQRQQQLSVPKPQIVVPGR